MVFDFYILHVTSFKKIPAVSEFLRFFPILTFEIFVEYTQNAILSTHLIRPYSLISAHYVCTYIHNNISHSIIKLRHLKFLCPTYAICITSIWFHKSQSLLNMYVDVLWDWKFALILTWSQAKIRYIICAIWFQPKNLPRVP